MHFTFLIVFQVSEANPPVSPVATLSPAPSPSDGGGETVGGGGRWKVVREEEGRMEGVTTPHLQLLHVDKEQEGRYRCRVEYKGCIIFSQSASLSILEDEEIVRRLLGQCRETEEGVADAAVDRFLEEHGNSSRLAKKALVSVLDSTSDPTSLLQSFTNRQVPVNFLHNGMYPLHYACVKGHWRAVQHLITCGASKTALTQQDGRNALHLVSMRGDNNSLQFLIHTGADQLINVQDKYGKTPLHLACEAAGKIAPGKHISQDMRDIKTVIQNLLKNKSSLRTQDKNGQTPLHLAAMAGHPWVMEVFLLCDIGGVDDQDHDGNTCLHIASEMNWGEVVISLLERGANETLENKEHMTPLAVAEVKGHVEVADILQRKPGTVQRNRKQTLYFTVNKANGRPLSAHFGDVDMSTSPVTKSHKRLEKKSSSTDQQVCRSWSNLSANPAPDTAMKSPSSRSPSALLKMFHLTSPISHNGHELVNDNK
jgi:ankyrin repeat protein